MKLAILAIFVFFDLTFGIAPTYTYDITWASSDVLSDVMIQLSRDNGLTWNPVITDVANTNAYLWTVTGPPTTTALIRISGLVYTNPKDGSTIDFTNLIATSSVFTIL